MSQPSSNSGKIIDGGIAGICGVTVNFPLDSVKTRVQESKNPRGFAETAKNVYKQHGLLILYQGYTANLAFIIFEKALKLSVNDIAREQLADKKSGNVSTFKGAIAGGTAGFIQSIVTTPMELLKIKGQIAAKKGEQFSLKSALAGKVKQEGIRGLYRGWSATVVRDVPWSFLYFPFYANLKDSNLFGGGKSFSGNFLAGMIAGAVSSGVCTPLDVIKTRLQKPRGGDISKKVSYVECCKSIYKNEGVEAFFKGWQPRMICVGVLMAVAQGFYELRLGDKILNRTVRKGW